VAETCTFCDDDGPARCPRCGTPVCSFHGPYKAGLACRRCESEWDAGHRRRVLMLVPIGAVALAVSMVVCVGAFVLIGEMTSHGSLAGVFLMFGAPIFATVAACRFVTRVTFRRRFFSNAPARIPKAVARPTRE
jgi:hypothetical protein